MNRLSKEYGGVILMAPHNFASVFSALKMKSISINLAVYNLFNNFYESNGYTWGYIGGGTEVRENFYYPQAGINFMAGITLKL